MQRTPATTDDGTSVYVSDNEGKRGSKAPFFHVYHVEAGDDRWGYRCGNCRSFGTAMDPMGRIECTACGNRCKPEEWDAAHA